MNVALLPALRKTGFQLIELVDDEHATMATIARHARSLLSRSEAVDGGGVIELDTYENGLWTAYVATRPLWAGHERNLRASRYLTALGFKAADVRGPFHGDVIVVQQDSDPMSFDVFPKSMADYEYEELKGTIAFHTGERIQ